MKVSDYIEGKYRDGTIAVSDDEARAIGIPVPLLRGWYDMYANDQITLEQARQLMAIVQRSLNTAHSQRRKANAQWAIETIRLHFGREADCEALPKKTRKERKRDPARRARQERWQKFRAAKSGPVKTYAPAQPDFLQTYEWRRLRMEALKKYGAKCQCCGATPATGAVMNVDHIKPRRLFPQLALDINNLQVLCAECNHGKGNWDMTDWRLGSASTKRSDERDTSNEQ